MECTGKLKGVAKDWVSGKWNLTFEVDGDIRNIRLCDPITSDFAPEWGAIQTHERESQDRRLSQTALPAGL